MTSHGRHALTAAAAACLAPAARAAMRVRRGVRILMYHRIAETKGYHQLAIPPSLFDEQMARLRESGFTVVSLARALDALAGRTSLSSPAVAVTLDDGTLDHYEAAWPVLERYRIPATLYLVVDFLDGRTGTSGRFLTPQHVREMAAGNATFGVHGRTHRELPALSADDAWDEIAGARARLEDRLGLALDTFCYPRGAFLAMHATMATRAGFRAAVTTVPGQNRPGADLFRLRRTEVTARDRGDAFMHKLVGAYDPLHTLLQRTRRLLGRPAPLAPDLDEAVWRS